MGIHCEINLYKPPDGAFTPGSTVSGIIKYAVDKDTELNKITMSLKGHGYVILTDKRRRRRDRISKFRNNEDYVDIDHVIQNDEKGLTLSVGAYETEFNFKLPNNIPPTVSYFKTTPRYVVRCYIMYYIRIKFDRPGLLTFAKRFKKDITVVTGITSKLPTEPVIYGEEKKLFHLFSGKKSVVNIKASIENSVVAPGGKIRLNYEVENNSLVTIKGVESKLVEVYTIVTRTHPEVKVGDIIDTDSKTAQIQPGDTKNMDIVITVPSDLSSVENSKFVSRDYMVNINVNLPMPHFDAVLNIPVQIGDVVQTSVEHSNDPPPSYWEVMNEEKEDEKNHEDDDIDEPEEMTENKTKS